MARVEPTRGRQRRSTWRKDPDGRRERILAAAARLFGEKRFGSVRSIDIARAAGVSEGTIYHHFGSKQDLLREAPGLLDSLLAA